MDELEAAGLDDVQLEDSMIIVELSFRDHDGDRRTQIRHKSTTERSTVVVGMAEIVAGYMLVEDPDADDYNED
jgi:hypothetical protein